MADAQAVIELALAKVGLDALIDEATGYQEVRTPDGLHRLLLQHLPVNYDDWMNRLPDEFYQALWDSRIWRERQGTAVPAMSMGHELARAAESWEDLKQFIARAFGRSEA